MWTCNVIITIINIITTTIITTIIIVPIIIEMSVREVHFQTREEGNPYLPLTSSKSSDCTKVTTGLQANIHTKNTERLLQEKYNNFFALCPEEKKTKYFSALFIKIQNAKFKLMLMFGEWWVGVKRLLSIFCKQSLHQVADT